jgi:hypothetical protein
VLEEAYIVSGLKLALQADGGNGLIFSFLHGTVADITTWTPPAIAASRRSFAKTDVAEWSAMAVMNNPEQRCGYDCAADLSICGAWSGLHSSLQPAVRPGDV